MKYISKPQLVESLRQLAAFRGAVNKQSAQHILPFLALRWRNVGTSFVPFGEHDDFAFFDEFARLNDSDFPYFDPFAAQMRIRTHPHSNVATARKGTFFRSWHAGEQDVENGTERWRLTVDYLNIIKKKVLTKGGRLTKVPAIPLGMFLLRARSFPDTATPQDVGRALRDTFNLTEEEYTELFEEGTRPSADFATAGLSADEVLQAIGESGVVTETREPRSTFQELTIHPDDPVVGKVRQLLEDGYAGVIFVGPPGTSKSWYAIQVALALADGDQGRVRKIQFHRSFQYEQFVEGFVPNEDGTGFELREQLMLKVMEDADVDRAATYVVLIDELSRSDPGRVFGELLTYMEPTRRDEPFLLASGRETIVPPNVVFIATMNSRDKNVSEIDDAFDRRMAKLEFPPDENVLDQFLTDNRMAEDLRRRVTAFFRWVNTKYPLGHTFFRSVKDAEGLKRLWETQLRFVFEKQFRYEPAVMEEIRAKFIEITGVTL
jgi:hypothetical protein